jgi:hypothetical protein
MELNDLDKDLLELEQNIRKLVADFNTKHKVSIYDIMGNYCEIVGDGRKLINLKFYIETERYDIRTK